MNLTRRETLLGAAASVAVPAGLPTVAFGEARVSRLIVGGNPVSGNSHVSGELSREMVDYFTSANIKRMLRDCENAGINTWQSRADAHIRRMLHEYRQEGSRIQWIAQTAPEIEFRRNLRDIVTEKPIGIYHHGSTTDAAWHSGRIDQVQDALKAIRQTGARVGLGTHVPEVVDYAESKGWDVDFYMACVYSLSKGENFIHEDRVKMLERVRQTKKQCLIFKVYDATRQCDSPERMLAALELVARYAKPIDTLVIGMFPKTKDQAAENRQLFLKAFNV